MKRNNTAISMELHHVIVNSAKYLTRNFIAHCTWQRRTNHNNSTMSNPIRIYTNVKNQSAFPCQKLLHFVKAGTSENQRRVCYRDKMHFKSFVSEKSGFRTRKYNDALQ